MKYDIHSALPNPIYTAVARLTTNTPPTMCDTKLDPNLLHDLIPFVNFLSSFDRIVRFRELEELFYTACII